MKKITLCLLILSMSLAFTPIQSFALAALKDSTTDMPMSAEKAKAETMLLRLKEIKSMDRTNMTSSEKKNLRMEVKSIQKEMKSTGGGIYLSVGAIIIIILLLILLL